MPDCYLIIKPTVDIPLNSYKTFLENLNNKLPNLKISSAEYTIDVFCNLLIENNILFSVVGRTLYISYQKGFSFFGGQVVGYGGKKIYNIGCHVGGRTKFYQRGEDEDKEGKKGWKVEDLDRVRFEYTANRNKLINCGIGDLHSFVENPKFWEMNKNRWRFKEFKSEKHPCPWEKRVYQEQYLRLKKKLKDVYQATTTSQALEPLKSNLDFAMQKFDVDWSGDYIISDGKLIKIPY